MRFRITVENRVVTVDGRLKSGRRKRTTTVNRTDFKARGRWRCQQTCAAAVRVISVRRAVSVLLFDNGRKRLTEAGGVSGARPSGREKLVVVREHTKKDLEETERN